jgi:predicted small secreted protein
VNFFDFYFLKIFFTQKASNNLRVESSLRFCMQNMKNKSVKKGLLVFLAKQKEILTHFNFFYMVVAGSIVMQSITMFYNSFQFFLKSTRKINTELQASFLHVTAPKNMRNKSVEKGIYSTGISSQTESQTTLVEL